MMRQEALQEPEFLDELIAERTARNPDFPKLMEEAARRRTLLKELAYLLGEVRRSKIGFTCR